MLLLLFLLSLISPGSTQDYKMITVWGSADQSTQVWLSQATVAGWDDCVDSCHTQTGCLVVTLNGTTCFLFFEGDISKVMKGTEEAGIKVAFKLKSTETTCPGSLNDWFPYTTSFGNATLMGDSSYTITESSDSYTIKYEFGKLNSACADWLEGKPDCNDPCNTMMMRYPGTVISSMSLTPLLSESTTYRDCAMQCYMTPTCWFVYMRNRYCYSMEAARRGGIGYVTASIDMTPNQYLAGNIMVKMQFDPSWTCPANAIEALSSTYSYPTFMTTADVSFKFTKESDLVYPIEFTEKSNTF